MKGKTKQQKGITLIALIITIVVLLILAAVAISSIQENGILGYATNAADAWNKAQANEATMLQNYLEYLDKHSQGGTTALSAPTSIEGVSISGNNFTVKATGGTGATGYQYKVGENGTWSTTQTGNYTVTLASNAEYTWKIYARSVDLNENTSSTNAELTIIGTTGRTC